MIRLTLTTTCAVMLAALPTLAFQPTVAGPSRQFQFDVFVRL
jgi:hypothetical protein